MGAGNGTINIIANTIQLNTNTFRYIPWTSFSSLPSLSLSNVMNFPTGADCPVPPSTATLKYRYSVVGNKMYVNYCYYSASAGTNGNGVYQYLVPTVATLNTTDIVVSSTTSAYGTVVGNAIFKQVGSSNGMGKVFISNQNSTYGFMLDTETSYVVMLGIQGSSYYPNGAGNIFYQFDAMIPIN